MNTLELNDLKNTTVAAFVSNDYRKAEIFKKYGIDFCCGGKKSLEKVCSEKHIDVHALIDDLIKVESKNTLANDYINWELDFLADYIINQHHRYVIQSTPILFEYTQKVAKVHGKHNPETVRIAELFIAVADELNRHMCKEEGILFRYVKHLAEAKRHNMKIEAPQFGSIENPIRMMEHEHDLVGNIFKEIIEISNNYIPPEYACNTYKVSYAKLKEFEEDLNQHIHLENNILFPKAILLEKELF